MWVSPFRHLRIKGYLLLPEAYRSLSRLSSALSAKASTLRPYQLDLIFDGPDSFFCLLQFPEKHEILSFLLLFSSWFPI